MVKNITVWDGIPYRGLVAFYLTSSVLGRVNYMTVLMPVREYDP